jgi:hypothetical protein
MNKALEVQDYAVFFLLAKQSYSDFWIYCQINSEFGIEDLMIARPT